jgi:hypothetical protein
MRRCVRRETCSAICLPRDRLHMLDHLHHGRAVSSRLSPGSFAGARVICSWQRQHEESPVLRSQHRQNYPDFDVDKWLSGIASKGQWQKDLCRDGLLKAGLKRAAGAVIVKNVNFAVGISDTASVAAGFVDGLLAYTLAALRNAARRWCKLATTLWCFAAYRLAVF